MSAPKFVWALFDAAGARVGGDFRTRNCALLAIPTAERKHFKALEVTAVKPGRKAGGHKASREEQHARYIDCGPAAWDDR